MTEFGRYLLRRAKARRLDVTVDSTVPGQATLTITGGTEPYTLDSNDDVTIVGTTVFAAPGTYSVRVYDARKVWKYYDVVVN